MKMGVPSRTCNRAALAVLMAMSIGVSPVTFAQTNVGKDRHAPTAKFTPQDFEMFWAAIDEISRSGKKGDSRSWENAATGSGGKLKLLNVFTTADGRDCRRLQVDNHAKSLKGSSKQIVCANPEGKWMFDPGARPAPAPAPAPRPAPAS